MNEFLIGGLYDTREIIQVLKINTFENVVLQFPNKEVNIGIKVKRSLAKQFPDVEFLLLSDHLKPDCCVDIVGAQHVQFDLIVHFGYACYSECGVPIQYVLPTLNINIEQVKKILDNGDLYDSYLLVDQGYENSIRQIDTSQFKKLQPYPVKQEKDIPIGLGYYLNDFTEARPLVFVGKENSVFLERFLFQLGYHFPKIFTIDPVDPKLNEISFNMNKEITKRSAQIEKAKACKCFGLLVNNPSAQFVKDTLAKCQDMITQSGKKYFNYSMNNLTESKLGNFPEIDAYVIISCYNTALIDEKQYYKLVITPFDLQCSLDENWSFSGQIKSDNSMLQHKFTENKQQCQCDCESDMSQQLVLNKGELLQVDKIFQTLDFYNARTYQGINQDSDKAPSILKQGLSGLATNYK